MKPEKTISDELYCNSISDKMGDENEFGHDKLKNKQTRQNAKNTC